MSRTCPQEPHPADDLSGSDVARKLTILSRLLSINPSSLAALPSLPEGYASLDTETLIPSALADCKTGDEFVRRLPDHDAEFEQLRADAEKEGKVLRYVGVIDREAGVVKCGLEKCVLPLSFSPLFSSSSSQAIFADTSPSRPSLSRPQVPGLAPVRVGPERQRQHRRVPHGALLAAPAHRPGRRRRRRRDSHGRRRRRDQGCRAHGRPGALVEGGRGELEEDEEEEGVKRRCVSRSTCSSSLGRARTE